MTATVSGKEVKKESWFINLAITVLAFVGFAGAKYAFEAYKAYAKAVEIKNTAKEVLNDLCLANHEKLKHQKETLSRIEESVAELLLAVKSQAGSEAEQVSEEGVEKKTPEKLDKKIIYFGSSRCTNGRCRN